MLSSTLNIRRLSTQLRKKLICNMIQSDWRIVTSAVVRGKRSIDEFGVGENSVDRYLQIDNDMEADDDSGSNARSHPSMRIPRQVLKAHYTRVFTETSPSPYIVHLSKSCAEMLQLQLPDETENSEALRKTFASVFVGNDFVAGLDRPYCMNYGCHCYGQWFGQLGDGRAITLGEVYTDQVGEGRDERSEYYGQHLFELQLKGSGKSPYSRGFDGKAVMRSSVREYLASECMYHLGVPTTRALSLIGTGSLVRRPWYRSSSERNPYEKSEVSRISRNSKFSPDALLMEPGAVVCRVSRSFLRFGNLELFAMRKEFQELVQLADFVCFKEFPYLLEDDANKGMHLRDCPDLTPGNGDRYVRLYRAIAEKTALLVSEWMRVGYVQGNMNSDNTMLAGRTIDYGPFGFMEKFDPFFQPFTSDTDGKFSYLRQPNAMGVNVAVLGSTVFTALVKAVVKSPDELGRCLSEVEHIRDKEFANFFWSAYDDVRRRKLGFKYFSEETDGEFWLELQNLMHKSESDFTIFFRELSNAADSTDSLAALLVLQRSFPQLEESETTKRTSSSSAMPSAMDEKLKVAWLQWLEKYLARIQSDNRAADERRQEQNLANPKYLIRNWMSVLAYEHAAEKADYSVIDELMSLLQRPYDEGTPQQEQKWYRSTPPWASNMPGVAFMS